LAFYAKASKAEVRKAAQAAYKHTLSQVDTPQVYIGAASMPRCLYIATLTSGTKEHGPPLDR
jgi:hypothetical protein